MRLADARRLSGHFWTVVGVATILTLARFSEAFLILRSQNVGLPIALVPAVMMVMNIVYALAAYPAGALWDAYGPAATFLAGAGLTTLALIGLVLALDWTWKTSPDPHDD